MGHHHGVVAGPITERDLRFLREAVCIQTEKIYDSCKERDCIENQTVLFRNNHAVRKLLNEAINVKASTAEVVDVFADVESVPFKRGFYTVDVKFFIKVVLNFFVPKRGGGTKIVPVTGLVVFDKKVILFGSEGKVKIFKSHFVDRGIDTQVETTLQQDNLPISKIEVAEPIALGARIVEVPKWCCFNLENVPARVAEYLDNDSSDFEIGIEDAEDERDLHPRAREVQATVGLFSIIKLVRFVQLLIPAFDFCVPAKACIASTEDEPCELFDSIEFPVDEFYPPQKFEFPGAADEEKHMREEMEA